MERDLLIERTLAGLARAKAVAKVAGASSKTNVGQCIIIAADHAAGMSVSELAGRFSVSRANILGIVTDASSNFSRS